MTKEIETKLDEILVLVKKCPEELQEKCFELLFTHFFSKTPTVKQDDKEDIDREEQRQEITPRVVDGAGDSEIKINQIHTKVRALLKGADFTITDINNLFYFEDGQFNVLYDDLKSTKMSDSQIRLALMGALRNALSTGEFKITSEEVRALCDTHKCFDTANFATTFKKNKELFTEEYSRGTTEISLSPAGKKELARVAAEIARQ